MLRRGPARRVLALSSGQSCGHLPGVQTQVPILLSRRPYGANNPAYASFEVARPMSEVVQVLSPEVTEQEALGCLQYESWVLVPNGPTLCYVDKRLDSWGRRVHVLRSTTGDLVNLILCPMTELNFVQARGDRAHNVHVLFMAALTARGLPRVRSEDVWAAASKAAPETRPFFASLLTVMHVESTEELETLFATWLRTDTDDLRAGVAERATYRCLPEIVGLVAAASLEANSPSLASELDLIARVSRAVLREPRGSSVRTELAAASGVSPYLRRLLEVGPPGGEWLFPTPEGTGN